MLTASLCSCTPSYEAPIHLLLGSYSPADAEGIRLYDFDQQTGRATMRCGLSGIANPSYLCQAGASTFLSVSETDDGRDALHLFKIAEGTGGISMRLLSSQPTLGKAPCYVNYHPASSQAFTANYNGGSLSAFRIDLSRNEIADPAMVTATRSSPCNMPCATASAAMAAQTSIYRPMAASSMPLIASRTTV